MPVSANRRAPSVKALQRAFPTMTKARAESIRHAWKDAPTVENALDRIDDLLGTYGVETLTARWSRPAVYYCNMGDPYSTTLLHRVGTGTLSIECWGDILERNPNLY